MEGACTNVKKKTQHEMREKIMEEEDEEERNSYATVAKFLRSFLSQLSCVHSTRSFSPLSPHKSRISSLLLFCYFLFSAADSSPGLFNTDTPSHFSFSAASSCSGSARREDSCEVAEDLVLLPWGASDRAMEFEDYLPVMAEKLGAGEFMAEMCKGFELLAEPATGLITLESLRRNAAVLGLDSLSDADLQAMLREGDFDGDGALSQREFCVMMIRLSPAFMDAADEWFQWALAQEELSGEQSQKMKQVSQSQRPSQS